MSEAQISDTVQLGNGGVNSVELVLQSLAFGRRVAHFVVAKKVIQRPFAGLRWVFDFFFHLSQEQGRFFQSSDDMVGNRLRDERSLVVQKKADKLQHLRKKGECTRRFAVYEYVCTSARRHASP